jgi:hypothetical protein
MKRTTVLAEWSIILALVLIFVSVIMFMVAIAARWI